MQERKKEDFYKKKRWSEMETVFVDTNLTEGLKLFGGTRKIRKMDAYTMSNDEWQDVEDKMIDWMIVLKFKEMNGWMVGGYRNTMSI